MPAAVLVQLPVPQQAALAASGNVPLAAGALAVAAAASGAAAPAVEIVPPEVTDRLGDTLLADRLAAAEPAVLGLSLYLWNTERSLHLAREVKRRSPRTLVVVGGPEVSPDNPFLLEASGYDAAVTGEGELVFPALVSRAVRRESPAGLPGVATRGADGRVGPFTPPAPATFPLDRFPSPYVAGALAVDPARSTYVETVRGCRSHCTFCFYPRSSNVLRVLDVPASAALVAGLVERGAREVVFLDPTFNHRPGLPALLEALRGIGAGRRVSYFAEVRAEGLTRAHAAAFARAGFGKLELGLQSSSAETLRRIRRGGSAEKVAAAAHVLREEGVRLLVDLILGLPGEGRDEVLRSLEFVRAHGLEQDVQVFPLSVLPGTAMRADAARDGLVFDAAPPYQVRRTSALDEEALRDLLFEAEDLLGRRLDEVPRPHLVAADGSSPADVFTVDLDREGSAAEVAARAPGTRHAALWLAAGDLFAHRDRIDALVAARLEVDPYATLDVVLAPRGPFPLDLLELVERRLARAAPSYQSRALRLRGEDAQRRVVVSLGRGVRLPPSLVSELVGRVPVFGDTTAAEALSSAERLGDDLPAARITDAEVPREVLRALAARADPEAVVFATRELERAWIGGIGYAEID